MQETFKTVTRSCPVCKKQALVVSVNRFGKILSVECLLCGNTEKTA